MLLILGTISYLTLKNKFSKTIGLFGGIFITTGSLILNHLMKMSTYHHYLILMLSFFCIYSINMAFSWQSKRKFYSLPLFFIPLITLISYFVITKVGIKKELIPIGTGVLLGFMAEVFSSLPFSFQSFKEFYLFKKYLKGKRTDLSLLIRCLELNITNFVTTKELLQQINKNSEMVKNLNFKKSLIDSLFYWTQRSNFNSLNPLAQKFNSFTLDQLKKDFVVYDLDDKDVDLIFNVFKCGCWKPGLFILDQYLVSNKLSSRYPSALIFADKFLNDLKKVSFDDESIEYWLQRYSSIFKGTPISQKINLVYHNKDDWFSRDIRHAAI